MTITAKYPGKCSRCGQPIRPGDPIEWTKGGPVYHVTCPQASKTQPKTTPATEQTTSRSIPDLIREINAGRMTVEQAVDDIAASGNTYGIKFWRPTSMDQVAYWDMLHEWNRREAAREAAAPVVQPAEVPMTHCACGHWCPTSEVMNASLGTSCPDCYDRMSGC